MILKCQKRKRNGGKEEAEIGTKQERMCVPSLILSFSHLAALYQG